MLKFIVDKQIISILLGAFTLTGIGSKCVVNTSLSHMVRAAGNMNKSNHPLMRLVRAKFEHACMVSEKVENVDVFVDKYLYEYRVFGIRLHSMRRLEKGAALLCIVTGLLGAALTYSVYGMNDAVLRTGVIGAGLGILVYVFHLTTDETYRLQMARNYMVDYLQNVCLRRYEKAYQKELNAKEAVLSQAEGMEISEEEEEEFEEAELEEARAQAEAQTEARAHTRAQTKAQTEARAQTKAQTEARVQAEAQTPDPVRPRPGTEVPSPGTSPEILPPTMPQPYPKPEIQAEESEKPVDREVLIRQILEEFMA